MTNKNIVLLICLVTLASCKKDPPINPQTPLVIESTPGDAPPDFTCKPYQYWPLRKDSIINLNEAIRFWTYNPANLNEIIYGLYVKGQIWCYNRKTQQRNYIADNCLFGFDVNKKGWIVFNKFDAQVYKVKSNGDSLKRITSSRNNFNPVWDFTDNAIYYAQEDNSSYYIVKVDANGKKLDSLAENGFGIGVSKISDKVAYGKVLNGQQAFYLRDMAAKTETLVASGADSYVGFIFDNKDEFLYYSTDSTLERYNVKNHDKELILKNCPNYRFGSLCIPYGVDNKLPLAWEKTTFKKPYYIQEYKTLELDLNTREIKEVKIFPK